MTNYKNPPMYDASNFVTAGRGSNQQTAGPTSTGMDSSNYTSIGRMGTGGTSQNRQMSAFNFANNMTGQYNAQWAGNAPGNGGSGMPNAPREGGHGGVPVSTSTSTSTPRPIPIEEIIEL